MDGKVQLYQRPGSPHWQCACSHQGRQVRANTKTQSLSLAAAFAGEWYLALQRGETLRAVSKPRGSGGGSRTFAEAAERFMLEFESITQGQRSPIYVEGHHRRLSKHLTPFFGATDVRQITSGMIVDYRISRMKQRYRGKPPARTTLHQEIVCLRQVLKTALRHRWLDHLPDMSLPYRQSGKIAHRAWFTAQEWEQLDAALSQRAAFPLKPRWRAQCETLRDCARFLVHTGLRPDEALRLQYRDVEIVIDEATGERILEIAVRGKRGVGWCKSLPEAVDPFLSLKARSGGRLTDRLFRSMQHQLFNTVLDELDLKVDREGQSRTTYSLRHTYICLRLLAGADIYQVAKNCRTSVAMIETYYAAHIKNVIDASAINRRKSP